MQHRCVDCCGKNDKMLILSYQFVYRLLTSRVCFSGESSGDLNAGPRKTRGLAAYTTGNAKIGKSSKRSITL